MSLDLNSTVQSIQEKLESIKTYNEVSKAEKDLSKSAADSFSKANSQITTQLNKAKDFQKRYLKEPPNSMSQLLGFLGQTQGKGSETIRYLRKKMLEVSSRIEPQLSVIFKEETIKALGCSVEQTYNGINPQSLQLQPLPLQPQQNGIYIPVNSIDLFASLKQSPETNYGKIFYEAEQPSASERFRPYGGDIAFPMNKQLYSLMDSSNAGRSFSQVVGKNYLGESGQNLFDVQYTTTNNFGVTGNYYRMILINREDGSGNISNNVGEFLSDYYSTIRLVDNVDIGAAIVNILSGAINTQTQVGFGQLEQSSKFELLIQRILGLCFDSRREIDVSGVAKIAELDGVDDSFFELTEVDLRNIEVNISNIQKGVMEFEDCNNIKLPVDTESLVTQLINFRNGSTGQTISQQVATIEQIIDSISDNPDWKINLPTNFNVKVSIDTNVIKKIPLAIASCVLSPKVLLPLYTLLSVVQSGATYTYNQVITSANTNINNVNQVGNAASNLNTSASNVVESAPDFIKTFKTFTVQVVSRINAIFLVELFNILKKDIINLMSSISKDVQKERALKKAEMILRLIQIILIVIQLVSDYRRCKDLLNNILLLLRTIGQLIPRPQPEIPLPLLALAGQLPGISAVEMTMSFIQQLQKLGLPTGPLPDGSPNLYLQGALATFKSAVSNITTDGKVYTVGQFSQVGKLM